MALELRPKRVIKDRKTPWKRVNWVVDIPKKVRGDRRSRRFFTSEIAALEYIDQVTGRQLEHGQAGIREMHGCTVAQSIKDFLKAREDRSGTHNYRLAEFWLEKFKEKFGNYAIKTVAGKDLERFWKAGGWGANTQKQAFAYLRMFFNWCERQDLIDRNPARRVEPPKGERPERKILTPGQMLALLKATEDDSEMRAYLCLGGFAGLRTSEILSGKVTIEEDEIHVQDGKTGGRYVTKLASFTNWWPKKYGKMDDRTFRRRRIALVKKVEELDSWPENGLRHSFASYHLALNEDAGKTAFQLGHTSPQMVYKAYARAVRKEEAAAYFAL